jgi:hypothetical protein
VHQHLLQAAVGQQCAKKRRDGEGEASPWRQGCFSVRLPGSGEICGMLQHHNFLGRGSACWNGFINRCGVGIAAHV